MSKLKISRGFRKFLRAQKAQIRRKTLDLQEQKKQIKDLYARYDLKDKILAPLQRG